MCHMQILFVRWPRWLNTMGGNIGNYDTLVNIEIQKLLPHDDVDTVEDEKLTLFCAISRSKALTIGFLKRSNHARYGDLINDLDNQYSRGTDQYSMNLPKALNTINCYVRGRNTPRNQRHPPQWNNGQEIEINFIQNGPSFLVATVFYSRALRVLGAS